MATAIRINMDSPKSSLAAPATPTIVTAPAVPASTLDSVYSVVKQLGKASPKEVSRYLGASRTTVARALKALTSTGALRATGHTNGRQYVAAEMEAVA